MAAYRIKLDKMAVYTDDTTTKLHQVHTVDKRGVLPETILALDAVKTSTAKLGHAKPMVHRLWRIDGLCP